MNSKYKGKPLLFSGPMVHAILNGDKTQTRRAARLNASGRVIKGKKSWDVNDPACILACPFGSTGDLLWVREATIKVEDHGFDGPVFAESVKGKVLLKEGILPSAENAYKSVAPSDLKVRPSIHMPQKYCRIWLEITNIKLQKLQCITETDAMAEGGASYAEIEAGTEDPARNWFKNVWTRTNGEKSYNSNPFVWAISFKLIEPICF